MGEPESRVDARHLTSALPLTPRSPQLLAAHALTSCPVANTMLQNSRRFGRNGRQGRRRRTPFAKQTRSVNGLPPCQPRMATDRTALDRDRRCSFLPLDISQAHIRLLHRLAYRNPWTGTMGITCILGTGSLPHHMHRLISNRCTTSVSATVLLRCGRHPLTVVQIMVANQAISSQCKSFLKCRSYTRRRSSPRASTFCELRARAIARFGILSAP
jgi:hypothetical protein